MTDLQWARLSQDTFNAALVCYLAAMVGYSAFLAFRRDWIWRAAHIVTIAGAGLQLVSVITRGVAAHRVPWGNMYEYSSLLALLVVVGYLVVVEGIYKIRTLGVFVLMFSVLTMGASIIRHFYVEPGPLVPALNSYWIKIHVVAAISGSSLFALGGVLTILYLVQARREQRHVDALRRETPPPIMGGATDLDQPSDLVPDSGAPMGAEGSGGRRGILPSAATLDLVAYRVIAFAFPIWTFAVIAGAIWAQDAWGRYWGWDPKETWSFITWVVFAGYLHARATSGWRGRKAAWVAIVGFVSLLITYYVVNLWIVGLHSYKGF
jgi:cytochrome c-type biogenesis protein CcsB